VYNVIRRAK